MAASNFQHMVRIKSKGQPDGQFGFVLNSPAMALDNWPFGVKKGSTLQEQIMIPHINYPEGSPFFFYESAHLRC
jgi:hypothetical protein